MAEKDFDLYKRFGDRLLFDAGRLNQEYEGRSAAIEDRHFGCIQINPGVVDAQPGKGGHQVLNGSHPNFPLGAIALQTGTHARIADTQCRRRQIHRLIEIDATEDDAGIRGRRTQHHIDAFARVQANAGGANQRFEGSLFKHVFEKIGKAAHFTMRHLPIAEALQTHYSVV